VTDTKTRAMRAIAYDMIARGFAVFPIQEDSNEPIKGVSRRALVTKDPTKVDGLWHLPYNVGVDADASDLVIVDADMGHHEGQNGLAQLVVQDIPLDTFTVKTPSGGLHLYFKGPLVQSGVSVLGPGLDIRSHAQYVVAPGCPRIDLKRGSSGTYAVASDVPVATLPGDIRGRLRPPRDGTEDETGSTYFDTPESISQVVAYLTERAPPAIEGHGGNSVTYKVAARVKDYGVSRAVATELMAEHWNEQKALPPWNIADLDGVVRNAYNYGASGAGVESAEVMFDGVKIPEGMQATVPTSSPPEKADILRFGQITPLGMLPARPWIIRPFLIRGQTSAVTAAGATGKSTWAFWLAVAVATGTDFLGQQVEAPGKVIIFSSEDDRHEMERRAYAYCILHGVDPELALANIAFVPGNEMRLKVARGPTAEIDRKSIASLAARCRAEGVSLIIVDPLTGTHESNENDNTAMSKVAEAFDLLAYDGNCSVLLVHHTKKGFGKNGVSAAGDADAGRGAGSLVASARINFTLVEAEEEDAVEYGLPEISLGDYVRLDGAKLNLTKKSREPIWFQRFGVSLGDSGDEAVAMKLLDVKKSTEEFKLSVLTSLEEIMDEADDMGLTLYNAAKALRVNDPMWGTLAQRTVENRLQKLLKFPVQTGKGMMVARLVQEGNKTTWKVVLE
jgi:hypothetical protein